MKAGTPAMIAFVRPVAPANRYIQNVPLNYLHLAAYLRERSYAPLILDMVLDEMTPERVDLEIRSNQIKVAGIGCMTCEFPQAVAEAARLKRMHPEIQIVFGGAHPSGDPEECLRTGVVDYAVVGEGEIALAELLEAIRDGKDTSGIPGVWSIRDGAIRAAGSALVPDVLELPRPAFDLLNLDKYFRLESPWHFPKSRRAVQFITERGCPYQCSYCHEIHTKKFRGLPAETVLDQMEWLLRTYGVGEFMIVDDIFNFDLERAKQICRGIVERKLGIHLQFPNGVRGDRFDEELIALMKAAGTHYLAIAIETVSEKFQKLVRKNLKIDRARQSVAWARKHGIEVSGFFMIGFPGESAEEVRQTLEFAATGPFDAIFISIVAPFKGTRLRTDMVSGRFGEISNDAIAALDNLFPVVHNQALSRETLLKMQRDTYWRFYTKPRAILNLARKVTDFRNTVKITRAITRRVLDRGQVSVN
jgi:anaerobic magnesium-protoporphyrin IX monomethyl ester cyclase